MTVDDRDANVVLILVNLDVDRRCFAGMEFASVRESRRRRQYLISRLVKVIPLLKKQGVEKILLFGFILNEERFQWMSDIDIALYGEDFPFRKQLRIISLMEASFGEDGFHVVFLAGEEFRPREAVLHSILRENIDAEQVIKDYSGPNKR